MQEEAGRQAGTCMPESRQAGGCQEQVHSAGRDQAWRRRLQAHSLLTAPKLDIFQFHAPAHVFIPYNIS